MGIQNNFTYGWYLSFFIRKVVSWNYSIHVPKGTIKRGNKIEFKLN